MRYTHYSEDKNLQLLDMTPQAIKSIYNIKPVGLWIGHDEEEGWSNWCESANFQKGDYKYEVNLIDKNLLYIKTNKDIIRFNNEYRIFSPINSMYTVDWIKLFYKYNGIMIFPYRHEARLDIDFMWYYGWDCASGCIWRPSEEVKSIRRNNEQLCCVDERSK